jgi:4-hydroxybenzoyl-CoA reductase beta subunit
MQLPRFKYVRPTNLAEGLAALAEQGANAAIMSGGSDLLMNMKFRLDTPEVVISLNGIPELQEVEELSDGSLRIGGGCTLTALAQNLLIAERYPALHDAIYSVGSRHVRNIATLGGNLCLDTRCWYVNQSENWRRSREGCFKTDTELCHAIKSADRCHAINSSDTAPVLIALGAEVILARHGGERRLPVLDFFRDDGVDHTVRHQGEVLVAVIVPPGGGHAVFAKLSQRTGLDYAAGTFAAFVAGDCAKPDSVRLVLGSIAAMPKVLTESERLLMEAGLTDDAIERAALSARLSLGEITNLYTPAGYKRRLIKALVRDALLELRTLKEAAQASAARR